MAFRVGDDERWCGSSCVCLARCTSSTPRTRSCSGALGRHRRARVRGGRETRRTPPCFDYFRDVLTLYVVLFVMLDILAERERTHGAAHDVAVLRDDQARGSVRHAHDGSFSSSADGDEDSQGGVASAHRTRASSALARDGTLARVMPVRRRRTQSCSKPWRTRTRRRRKRSEASRTKRRRRRRNSRKKLGALAVSMEVHVMNKLERRAQGDRGSGAYEASKELMAGHGAAAEW